MTICPRCPVCGTPLPHYWSQYLFRGFYICPVCCSNNKPPVKLLRPTKRDGKWQREVEMRMAKRISARLRGRKRVDRAEQVIARALSQKRGAS